MIHARTDYQRIQDPAGLIPAGEPVMLFRAQDVLAPAVLDAYAHLLNMHTQDRYMIETVSAHARMMREWQRANVCKLPDMPATAGRVFWSPLELSRVKFKHSAATVRVIRHRQSPSEILIEQDTGERSWVTLDAVEPAP